MDANDRRVGLARGANGLEQVQTAMNSRLGRQSVVMHEVTTQDALRAGAGSDKIWSVHESGKCRHGFVQPRARALSNRSTGLHRVRFSRPACLAFDCWPLSLMHEQVLTLCIWEQQKCWHSGSCLLHCDTRQSCDRNRRIVQRRRSHWEFLGRGFEVASLSRHRPTVETVHDETPCRCASRDSFIIGQGYLYSIYIQWRWAFQVAELACTK